MENTPKNYLLIITSEVSSQDNSQSEPTPPVCCLGDGSLKADYEIMLQRRYSESRAQMERNDVLALKLLQEEEQQLRCAQEKREAMLLEDARVAADLSRKLQSQSSTTWPRSYSEKDTSSIVDIRPRSSSSIPDTRAVPRRGENIAKQKNGILRYFGVKEKNNPCQVADTKSLCEKIDRKRKILNTGVSTSNSKTLHLKQELQWPGDSCADDVVVLSQVAEGRTDDESIASPGQYLTHQDDIPTAWNCTICTFSNHELLTECEMCGCARKNTRLRVESRLDII